MRTIDELKHYYRQDLKQELARFERRRKALLLRFCIILGIIVTAAYCLGLQGIGVLALIAGVIGLVIYAVKSTTRYVTEFKRDILGKLVTFMSPELTYEPKSYIEESAFQESRLFERARYNRYGGDDLIHGELDGLQVRFSELRVVNSKGKDSSTTVFHGLFVAAESQREFRGTTTVAPDLMKNLKLPAGFMGDMVQKLIDKLLPEPSGAEVEIDDAAFNEHFTVYSDEPDEARRFLSEPVRASLLALNEHLQEEPQPSKHPYQRSNVRVCFQARTIYVAVDCRRSLFSVNIFRTLKSYRIVDRFFEDMHRALTVVATLRDVSAPS